MENEKTVLTREGYERLQRELKHLNDAVLPEVIRELQDARAQGDLSENADYDAARTRQAQVTSRIQEIENQLQNSEIISEKASRSNKVSLGSTVKIHDFSTGLIEVYTIVGPVEADPLAETNKKISYESPLAHAIIGESKGKRVLVKVKDPYEVEIIDIIK